MALRELTADVRKQDNAARRARPAGRHGTVHQAFFVGWAVVTGLHTLARLGPALALAGRPSGVPGERRRLAALIMTLVIAVIAATLLLGTANPWRHAGHRHHAERPAAAAEQAPSGTAGPRR